MSGKPNGWWRYGLGEIVVPCGRRRAPVSSPHENGAGSISELAFLLKILEHDYGI